jgi:large subunit ribosomal protein L19
MPFLHHRNHDERPKPKFKNPRKRASKLLNQLQTEAVAKSKASKPEVWDVPFKVGDAVELEVLEHGGVDNPNNHKLDKIRGVVLGRENKGLDTSIYLKDVLFGEHVERKVKLHSPMVKSLKVLEEGFVNKGKKKGRRVKRAKLYYLRDLKPEITRVTPIQK